MNTPSIFRRASTLASNRGGSATWPGGGRWWWALVLASGFGLGPSLEAALRPVALRTEYLEDPTGIESTAPRLGWKFEVSGTERGVRQTAYRILAASDPERLGRNDGDLWDSGRVASSETIQIPYAGRSLGTSQRVFWKVQVWDGRGDLGAWSAPARWTMGVVRAEDWRAEWIAYRDTEPLPTDRSRLHLPPARHYRRVFEAVRTVRRATIHASALGIYELHVNGERVGDAWFEPGWADYAKRSYYRTYDVTGRVQSGRNVVGAIVADGWYAGYVGYGLLVGYGPNRTGRNIYGKTPAVRVQLEIEYADGTREVVGTDTTWEVSGDGPIREADLLMGESFDARRDRPDWCRPGGAGDWRWEPAISAGANGSVKATFHDTLGPREVELGFRPPPRMQAYSAPPIRVTQELKAVGVDEIGPGVYLFDLGQNIAGAVRLRVKGVAGSRVQLRFGEMRHPDGRLMTENLRRARATDDYTLRGDPDGETWQPRFTYHGFRYVEVTGPAAKPGLEAVTGLVVHNDTPLTGEFACSDEVMTRFWKNTQWTQRANFVEMPTDCPQRDERLGWMGDAQAYVRAATYNADVAAFFGKWMDDVVEAQREFGAYPDYAPYPMAHGSPGQTWGTAWTDAGILCPWTIWKVYGDIRMLERLWPSMTRFMEWRRRRAPDFRGRGDGNGWGDWLNVNEPTPLEMVDAAYFKFDADRMADMAQALGRQDEAAGYRRLSESIAARFVADYRGADGRLTVPSQTAHVLTLAFGLVPEAERASVARQLAERVAARDHRMSTGFLGTRDILPALSRHGQHDLAVRLFQSRKFPSWGYEVVNGATTVWERWDSFTREHGFNGSEGNQNASMNSFSHYAFGAITAWMFGDLAGIDTDGEGYRKILIRPGVPAPDGNPDVVPVHWVRAEYDSIRGTIGSAWARREGRLEFDVTIPPNTTATVEVPAPSAGAVRESGEPLARARGVTVKSVEGGRVRLEIGSGRYRFEVASVAPQAAVVNEVRARSEAEGGGEDAGAWDAKADTWVATDGLGRLVPDHGVVGDMRPDRTVALFYFLWHGAHVQGGPYDVTRILATDPEAMNKPESPLWGPLHAPHHWGESIFGYYLTQDAGVLRKHAQMLADAGVDVVVFDVTNQITYRDDYLALMREWEAWRAMGNRTPQVAFLAPFWDPPKVVRELWRDLYGPGLHSDLWFRWEGKPLVLADPELIARRQEFTAGKEAVELRPGTTLGQTFRVEDSVLGVGGRFPTWGVSGAAVTLTLKRDGPGGERVLSERFHEVTDNAWVMLRPEVPLAPGTYYLEASEPGGRIGWWSGTEDRWERGEAFADGQAVTGDRTIRCLTVDDEGERIRRFFTFRKPQPDYFRGPTQSNMWSWLEVSPQHVFRNARGEKEQMSVGVGQNAVDGRLGSMSEPGARGRSFHRGGQDPGPGAVRRGWNVMEQWERALSEDPRVVFVTGWNEWIAGRFAEFNRVKLPVMFVDQYDQEHSRDIEPMRGGHGDDYYYQFVGYVRRYKGVRVPEPTVSVPIRIDGAFDDWAEVRPEYRDTRGDAVARLHRGWDPGVVYRNDSGRNDIVSAKVSTEGARTWFQARARETLTAAEGARHRMLLFVDVDADAATGWLGYDVVVGRSREGREASIERHEGGGWAWRKVGMAPSREGDDQVELEIDWRRIGYPGSPAVLDFKWADHLEGTGEASDFTLNGDAAPNDRFNYRFRASATTVSR